MYTHIFIVGLMPDAVYGHAGEKFDSPEEALKAWAKDIHDASVDSNIEFAGKLYKTLDGKWSYSPSTAGTTDSSNPSSGNTWVFSHGNPLESWDIHSHSSYEGLNEQQRFNVDQFSNPDVRKSENPQSPPQFMLTPGGELKEFIPSTGILDKMGLTLNGETRSLGFITGTIARPKF